MEEQACPRCKTTKYRNPHLKLLVNVCGHSLCDSCVDLLFLKGSGACPECNIPLRRNNFRLQIFEDPEVEKDVDIRKRVLRDFNKKEEDFNSLREYNDYLEELETIIYNLTHNIDVIATNKKIEQYKKDNKEIILKNKSKLGKDEYELQEQLEFERQQEEIRKRQIEMEESQAKKKKIKEKEALIDELMFSSDNASKIIQSFSAAKQAAAEAESQLAAIAPQTTQFSSGVKFNQDLYHVPLIIEEGPLYVYKPQLIEINGPKPPDLNEIENKNYISHVRAETLEDRAGGFLAKLACFRAIQEAFIGLYFAPQSKSS